jgi:hypothetical protein
MAIFETTDPRQADRCVKAQHGNKKITETFGHITITGKVQSVAEDLQSSPRRWTVTIIPN